MIPQKWVQIIARILLFVILFSFLCNFYLVDHLSDYFKHRTTVTSRYETKDNLEPPLITICMEPVFKTSVARMFGFWYNFDVFQKPVPNSTFSQAFSKLSYILNRDYMVKLEYGDMKEGQITVEGNNQIGSDTFIIQSIQTGFHGTCLNIQPYFNLTPTNLPFNLDLKILPLNLKKEDRISTYVIYFTTINTWQMITTSIWPQFPPSLIRIESGSNVYFNVRPMEYLLQDGIDNSETCWKHHIQKMNCKKKCRLVSNMVLPVCESVSDILCIYDQSTKLNLWSKCNMKNRALTYNGDLTRWDKYQEDNATYLNIEIRNTNVEIHEEVDVITMAELIGSLGGSLGMFFGFSISAYILCFIDKCIAKMVDNNDEVRAF